MQEIIFPRDALPRHSDAGGVVRRNGRGQPQDGERVGGIRSGNPFLPVAHAVAVRVRIVHQTVRRQSVLLQPGVGKDRGRRLELIRADVHRAAGDAEVAIEVVRAGGISVVAGIDARRTGLQVIIAAGLIDEQGRVGDVAGAARCQRRGAGEIQTSAGIIRSAAEPGGVEIDDTVVQRADVHTAAVEIRRVVRQRAVIQRGSLRAAAELGEVARQQAIVQGAELRAAALGAGVISG